MRISDWSSDVCSSDLHLGLSEDTRRDQGKGVWIGTIHAAKGLEFFNVYLPAWEQGVLPSNQALADGDLEEERRLGYVAITRARRKLAISRAAQRFNKDTLPSVFLCDRSEEHTSELQSLMRISYAVFCLKKKNN